MSLDSAIPLNRIAHIEQTELRHGLKDKGARGEQSAYGDRESKQRVNISQDTLMRMARSKLSKAMNQKLAYNRNGAIAVTERPVGQMLSAKA